MTDALVECVPNFSEGRNGELIAEIVSSAEGIEGCHILSSEPDADYNRTVVTLAGNPDAVSEAAFRLISSAKQHIDMREHEGEHPRLGAVDVCPFIPLRGISMADCSEIAISLGYRVATELNLPVYHYGESASDESRLLLSNLRKGEYEGLEDRLSDAENPTHSADTRWPDQGPRIWDNTIAKFGAVVIGARPILVAYNVNLDEEDAEISKKIGTLVRSSGRLIKQNDGRKMRVPGMLTKVQGMGVVLEEQGISQVSMNLLNVESTPLHVAFEAVKTIAEDHNLEVTGSELIGLVPLSAMLETGSWYHESPDVATDDELVQAASEGLGLSDISEFDAKKRIIEWAVGDN